MTDDKFDLAFTEYYNICATSLNDSVTLIKKRIWWTIIDDKSKTFRKVRKDTGEIYSPYGTTSIGNIYDSPKTILSSNVQARKEKRLNGWVKNPSIPTPENVDFEESFDDFIDYISDNKTVSNIKRNTVWIKISCLKYITPKISFEYEYLKIRSDTGEIFSPSGVRPITSIYDDKCKNIIDKKKK